MILAGLSLNSEHEIQCRSYTDCDSLGRMGYQKVGRPGIRDKIIRSVYVILVHCRPELRLLINDTLNLDVTFS